MRSVSEIIDSIEKDYQDLINAFTDELIYLKKKNMEMEKKLEKIKEKYDERC